MLRYLALALLILWSMPAFAADLAWDYPGDWGMIEGYTVYFTDGSDDFTLTVSKDELVVDGDLVLLTGIEDRLNLQYGVEYDLYITAHNMAGESGPSETVTHGRMTFFPPGDSLPDGIVINIPAAPSITINIGGQ